GMRYEEMFEVVPGVQVRFHDAGHIMGSAVVEVNVEANEVKRTLIFSGDLGQFDAPILRDPSLIERADIVLSESTYGNRVHRDRAHTVAEIGEIIKDAQAHKGNILIPAFAVGRSQEVLYMFGRHFDEWNLDRWHVFLDSPLAIEASHIYWDYPHLYDGEATKLRRNIDVLPDKPRNLHLTKSAEESMVINKVHGGAIIIAGSGMCNGGRILHHLKHNAWRRECHIIIVGYQAQGSLGRRLVDRKKFIKIHRETIRVKAQVHTVGGLSAHGDQTDLTRWYAGFKNKPPLYLVHGEPESAAAYSEKLRADLNAEVHIPQSGAKVDLTQLNRSVRNS
ncbi:MAG: MBL fold metallo-hydrolase, partial [Gammaproteobacteria bacterium]|nr:MBL fold metallo-hydrolase [Gammaproteobacteria bacterium]